MSHNGARCIGVICTYFRAIYTPPPEAFEILDFYAEFAASAIERHQQLAQLALRDLVSGSVTEMQVKALQRIQEQIKRLENRASPLAVSEMQRVAHSLADQIEDAIAGFRFSRVNAPEGPEWGLDSETPYGLSPREIEVLVLVWRGLSDKQIARAMEISRFTVAKHLGAAMRKMKVESRSQASVLVEREALYNPQLARPPKQNVPGDWRSLA